MSAGSCVASRSRSRLDISASVTWLKRDSRRASNLSRYDFTFLLSILLYAPLTDPACSKPCQYESRRREFQNPRAALLLIRQPPRDRVSPVQLLDEEDARHLVRQRQPRERPAQLRPPPHLLAHAEVPADDEGNLPDRARLPSLDLRRQLFGTPTRRPRNVEQNRQSVRCKMTQYAFPFFFDARPVVRRRALAHLHDLAPREPRKPFQIIVRERTQVLVPRLPNPDEPQPHKSRGQRSEVSFWALFIVDLTAFSRRAARHGFSTDPRPLTSDLFCLPRQPLVQILPTDTQDTRGFGFVTADGFQHLADVVGLNLGERRAARLRGPRARGGRERFGQVAAGARASKSRRPTLA